MTKGELIDKAEDYNQASQSAYYTNTTSSDMKMYIDNLKQEWTTDHGTEIVGEMEGIFHTIEDAMNAMENAMAAIKNCSCTISTHEERSTRTETSGGGS